MEKTDSTTETTKSDQDIEEYIFKERFTDETDAFSKYYSAITENGYILKILMEVECMGDYCDLFESSNKFGFDKINLFYKPITSSDTTELLRFEKTVEKGRHLVAKKDIRRDTILINEIPTVLQVNPLCTCVGDNKSVYRCHHCGVGLKLFYTCDGCNVAVFCSRVCLGRANKEYHSYECFGLQRHFWSMDDEDYSYLSFRMMLYGASKKFIDVIQDSSVLGSVYANSSENNYPLVCNMETNFSKMSLGLINKILYSSVRNILYLLRKTNFFLQPWMSFKLEAIHTYIGGLLVKHYCQAQMNSIIIKYPNYNEGFGFNFISGSGKAICPTIALLNHSCSPNAAIVVSCEYIVVKSIKNINPGDEITVCYYEVSSLLSYLERCTITHELLFFTCDCSFCLFEKRTYCAPFLCPSCSDGHATLVNPSDEFVVGYCFDCDNTVEVKEILDNLKAAEICEKLYQATCSLEHVTRIAEIFSKIYRMKSIHLLDIYRCLYEKYVTAGEKPLEILKYGLLMFNIAEQLMSRLYLPILVSKVSFITCFTSTAAFSRIRKVTQEERQTIQIFVSEVTKVKKDIMFYISSDHMEYYDKMEREVHKWFRRMTVDNQRNAQS